MVHGGLKILGSVPLPPKCHFRTYVFKHACHVVINVRDIRQAEPTQLVPQVDPGKGHVGQAGSRPCLARRSPGIEPCRLNPWDQVMSRG